MNNSGKYYYYIYYREPNGISCYRHFGLKKIEIPGDRDFFLVREAHYSSHSTSQSGYGGFIQDTVTIINNNHYEC